MNKTLHSKLTEKHFYGQALSRSCSTGEDTLTQAPARFIASLEQEMKILQHAAKDLLQPRPQAISKLLQLAREI